MILAGAGSAALLAGGIWLHARRGRTEAAVAMVGPATAGAFATLVVAGDVYRLIPAPAAIVAAMLIGGLATALAIRWAGRAVAVLGLIGALLSPLLAGVPHGFLAIALLAVAAACSMSVVVWRRWLWLALATVLVSAPQWALLMTDRQTPIAQLGVLLVFGSIGLAGAIFTQLRTPNEDDARRCALALVVLNAAIFGVAGRLAFGTTGGVLWLAGLALVHAAVGLWRRPRIATAPITRRLLLALGVVIADVALGLALNGVVLTAAWGASAVGFAWLSRRVDRDPGDQAWLTAGLGAHIGLVLVRALIELPPSQLAAGPELVPLASVAILAATCLGSARISAPAGDSRLALNALGLLSAGYMTAATLDGARALVAGSGVAVLYLASVAVISAFQPAAGTEAAVVLDLSVRQQGQVLLSAMWGLVGIVGLVGGLRGELAPLRNAALALLLAAVAKVFLYDLSTVTSIYRVVSFFVLGGLLLVGAFAYQQLRPPPLPDLRTVDKSRR